MPTWVMGRYGPASLKKTRSPGRRSDFSTLSPIYHCPTGLSGIVTHSLKTRLVKQEQSSDRKAVHGIGGECTYGVPRCVLALSITSESTALSFIVVSGPTGNG